MSKINPQIFREYDIRGIADIDLTDDNVYKIALGYATYINQFGYKEVLVGRDVRLSSERIRDALVAGLLDAGCQVIDLGIIPTPVFYFSAFYYDKNAGLMITGSHNPKEFNGFKIGLNKTTIYGKEIQKLREIIEEEKFVKGKGELSYLNPIPDYLSYLKSKVKFQNTLKVVFDPGNGTGGYLLEELLKDYPIEPAFINLEPDGSFPNHLPDPTIPEYMKDVISLVNELDASLGIGYDGDCDRIGAVDDKGKIVFGDQLLALYASEIVQKYPKAKIVFDVKCSQGLIEYLNKINATPIMWKTGHSLIKNKMKEEGALLAGEMSGHMFFADDYFGYDDAIYASLRLLKIIADSGKKLSELLADIPKYYFTPEIRIDCPDEEKFRVVEEVKKYFKGKYEIIDIDGVRVIFPDGWGLLRASNTQPVLVLRFEGKNEKALNKIKELFLTILNKYPFVKIPNL
jgi:phosphomannomutase/phosphoglucomutase|uniref:Phosphomannomutase/phosphoglucomutase n=1 Tax=candidate division WOR-3 bacterium TaxID=2052148 RepID=A0A7V5Y0H6_UNCW3